MNKLLHIVLYFFVCLLKWIQFERIYLIYMKLYLFLLLVLIIWACKFFADIFAIIISWSITSLQKMSFIVLHLIYIYKNILMNSALAINPSCYLIGVGLRQILVVSLGDRIVAEIQ